jgi:signal transduction histidine kinase
VGYDPTRTEGSSHYGLKGMRERVSKVGGDISVTTAPNQGTEINITVPFEAE